MTHYEKLKTMDINAVANLLTAIKIEGATAVINSLILSNGGKANLFDVVKSVKSDIEQMMLDLLESEVEENDN